MMLTEVLVRFLQRTPETIWTLTNKIENNWKTDTLNNATLFLFPFLCLYLSKIFFQIYQRLGIMKTVVPEVY